MNIDSINAALSWENIAGAIKESLSDLPVKDLYIRYENGIVISGNYILKIEIPFSVEIRSIYCSQRDIILDIGDINVYLKVPFLFKDILIKNIIRKYQDSLSYQGSTIIMKEEFISGLLPFEDYNIVSISTGEKYLEVSLTGIKLKVHDGVHEE